MAGPFRYIPGVGSVVLPSSPRVTQAPPRAARPQVDGFTPTDVGGGVIASPSRRPVSRSEVEAPSGDAALDPYAFKGSSPRGRQFAPVGGDGGDGGGGLWGTIAGGLGTLVGGVIDAADTGQRAVLATSDLIAGAAEDLGAPEWLTGAAARQPGDDRSHTSLSRWWDQVRGAEPVDRMGDRLPDTGNRWVDRFTGFVGDVATDPLTFVTAGGFANRAVGAQNRLALAQRAAQTGMADDVIETVARKGPAYLDDATRQQLGLQRQGVQFANMPIPGTGGLAGAVGRGVSTARRGLGELPGAGIVRDLRTPERLSGAYRRALFGEGDGTARAALEAIASENRRMATAGAGQRVAQKSLDNVLGSGKNRGLLTEVEEALEPSDQALGVRDWVRRLREDAVRRGADIGDRSVDGRWVPHYWHDKALKYLGWVDEMPSSGKAANPTSLAERKILPGETRTINGKQVTFERATIDDINSTLTKAFPDAGIKNWVDTDAKRVLSKYANDMTEASGRGAQVSYLEGAGLAYRGGASDDSALRQVDEDLADFAQGANPSDPVDRVTGQLLQDEAAALSSARVANMTQDEVDAFATQAAKHQQDDAVRELLADGWQQLDGAYRNQNVAVPPEVARWFDNIDEAARTGRLTEAWTAFQQFFKTHAIMTPGFQVRNAYSATFQNLADGVDVRNIKDGAKYFGTWRRHGDDWLTSDDWLKNVPEAERDLVRDARDAVYASGSGGQLDVAESGTGRLTNHWLARKARTGNEWIEGAVRMSNALDSLRKGATFDQAVARINRNHFNYSQLSGYDRAIKRVIPFWTFLSRNLPLQMQQLATNPSRAAMFERFRENFAVEPDELLPQYMREAGAFSLGLSWGSDELYFDPDLQHLSAMGDLQTMADNPFRFIAAAATPAAAMPFELDRGAQFFSDIPFADSEEAMKYAFNSLLPPVSQSGRLQEMPWTPGYHSGADVGDARLRYLGLPVRRLTEDRRQGEQRRRAFQDDRFEGGGR